jgi:hypothetical protein
MACQTNAWNKVEGRVACPLQNIFLLPLVVTSSSTQFPVVLPVQKSDVVLTKFSMYCSPFYLAGVLPKTLVPDTRLFYPPASGNGSKQQLAA